MSKEAIDRLEAWAAKKATFEYPDHEDITALTERVRMLEAALRQARRDAVIKWTLDAQKWQAGTYPDFVAKAGVPGHIAAMDEVLGDTIADEAQPSSRSGKSPA